MPKKKSVARAREAAAAVAKRVPSGGSDFVEGTPAMMLLSPYLVPTMPSSPAVEPMEQGSVETPAPQDPEAGRRRSYQVAALQ